MKARRLQLANNAAMKSSTKKYWEQINVAIFRTWPELNELEIVKVTPQQCEAWASRYAELYSASRFNGALETMKILFRLAVDHGIRKTNPVKHIKRLKPRQKDLTTGFRTPKRLLGGLPRCG